MSWKVFKEGLKDEFRKPFEHLNPPASENELDLLEARVGEPLPKFLVEMYAECNGESESGVGVIFGLHFLSIQEVLKEMDVWDEIIADGLDDFNEDCKSVPKNAIKCVYANHKWVPLFSDGGGNFIGLDFDPGPKGRVGQVINFGRDEEKKRVLAKTLDKFFQLMLDLSEKEYAGVNEDGSSHVADLCFIDAVKSARSLDTIVAKRSPDYGYYSFWVYPKPFKSLPDGYFDQAPDGRPFCKDFNMDKKDVYAMGWSQEQDGSVRSIEECIKFNMYVDKYRESFLGDCARLGISDASAVIEVRDLNYSLRENSVKQCRGVVFVGSYKVY